MRELKHAQQPSDLPRVQDSITWTGLEYLQKTIAGEIAAPPISGLMNFALHEIELGKATFRGIPMFSAFNPGGTPHGGWYGAIMDSAMACAIMSHADKGQFFTTLEYKVNIIRPVPEGMEVEVISTASHVGRLTGVSDAEMRGVENGKLYATASTTCVAV